MTRTDGSVKESPAPPRRPRISPALATAAAVALSLLVYLPALGSFFSNDDWVLLDYYGRINPWHFWEYFSPKTIWFYRALQSAQFGVFFHLFGLNDLPYNLSLFAMHAGVCALWFTLVRRLAGSGWLAAGSTALFAVMWNYVDVLLWKSNFNTLHWALLALATCNAYLAWLDTGARRWRVAALLFLTACFFAKEMAVSVPFLLLILWCERRLHRDDLRPPRLAATARRALVEMLPFGALTVLYILLHRTLLVDVATDSPPGYRFASPLRALFQCGQVLNNLLLGFYADPVLLPQVPVAQGAVRWFVGAVPLAGPLVAAVALWRRDRVLLFALGFALLSNVPTVFLETYHASRFYYLPAAGAALALARLLQLAWGAAGQGAGARSTAGRVALMCAAALVAIVNIGITRILVERDRAQSDRTRSVYRLIESRRGTLGPLPLVVIRNAPTEFFNLGLGTPEMVRFALGDPAAEGAVSGQSMTDGRLALVRARTNVHVLDFAREPLELIPQEVATPGPATP